MNSCSYGCIQGFQYANSTHPPNHSTLPRAAGTNTVVTVAAGIQGTLSNLTIRNGSAQNGGGIYSNGALTINQSTVIGNNVSVSCPNCYASGGGIYNDGSLTINNTTLSGNSALAGGGIIVGEYATATLQNSIVANSPSGGNCGGSITSNGYNMSSDSSCNFSKSGDRNNTDPMLGPLQNNGGPTQTMALLPGSLAIDAGNPSGCKDASGHLLTTDQRGMPRHDPEDTGGCDMGAYERQTD